MPLNKIQENVTEGFRSVSAKEAVTAGTIHVLTTPPPSWTRRITIMFDDVSGSGTSDFLVQFSTGAVFATTGYDTTAFRVTTAGNPTIATSTAGFILTQNNLAASLCRGTLVIEKGANNEWYVIGGSRLGQASSAYFSTGLKKLGGLLDAIRLTTVNGTDTFDSGFVNYTYEA